MSDLFADPAWDMVIDLFAAWAEGRRISVSSVCIASGVPRSTALRWVVEMERQGLVRRWPDARDGRRTFIEITRDAAEGVERWLNATFVQ
jgi:DNA-binding MarR family transcriptional regulator